MKRDEFVEPIPGRPCFTGLCCSCENEGKKKECVSHFCMRNISFSSLPQPFNQPPYHHKIRHVPVGHGELAGVHAHHLGLDLDGVEKLAVVDGHDRANQLGGDDQVTEVGLDDGGLLQRTRVLLGVLQLLDQGLVLALDRPLEAAADAGGEERQELLGLQVQQLVQVDATKGKLLEGTLLTGLRNAGNLLRGQALECVSHGSCWLGWVGEGGGHEYDDDEERRGGEGKQGRAPQRQRRPCPRDASPSRCVS